jgi:phosphoribosylformylglycinamidine cyclo-ligase
VDWGSWPVSPVFELIEKTGPVTRDEMLKTFNMGLGLMAVAPASAEKKIRKAAEAAGENVHMVGRIVKGSGKVLVRE